MSTFLTKLADIGVAGLGVMGANLALNLADKGQTVAVWDRTPARVLESTPPLRGVADLERFVESLARPRRILMMIKAGEPVDEMIARLRPLLSPGDILIDGGNSFYADTARREKALSSLEINYIGMGISGGEDGARHGPSLMPGGQREAYELLRPALERIAAQGVGGPCVTWVGPGGAGHFVKMIHNGIEYGDLQLIAETYDLMRRALGMEAAEIAGVMRDWNRGPLDSYLLGIAAEILTVVDPATGRPLVDLVMDEAHLDQRISVKCRFSIEEALQIAHQPQDLIWILGRRVHELSSPVLESRTGQFPESGTVLLENFLDPEDVVEGQQSRFPHQAIAHPKGLAVAQHFLGGGAARDLRLVVIFEQLIVGRDDILDGRAVFGFLQSKGID